MDRRKGSRTHWIPCGYGLVAIRLNVQQGIVIVNHSWPTLRWCAIEKQWSFCHAVVCFLEMFKFWSCNSRLHCWVLISVRAEECWEHKQRRRLHDDGCGGGWSQCHAVHGQGLWDWGWTGWKQVTDELFFIWSINWLIVYWLIPWHLFIIRFRMIRSPPPSNPVLLGPANARTRYQ